MKKQSIIAFFIVMPFIILFIYLITKMSFDQLDSLGIVAVLITLGFLYYYFYKVREFTKKMTVLLIILMEDKDIERFLDESNALLSKMFFDHIRYIILLIQASAYNNKGEFTKAIEINEAIDYKRLTSYNKAIYFLNLALYYCNLEDIDNANKVYKKGEKYINKLYKDKYQCASVYHLNAIFEYLKGNLDESERILEITKRKYVNIDLLTCINNDLAEIYIQTGRKEKSRILLEFNLTQNMFPCAKAKTDSLLNEINQQDTTSNVNI